MSGIAEVLFNQGYRVSGSDSSDSDTTRHLASIGIEVYREHKTSNVSECNVVVVSSAIKPSNPEWAEAKRLRIPVIPRAEMLGELMRGKTGIAVAGTHGKTTTTSLLAAVFHEAQLDPTVIVGGKVNSLNSNARLGLGEYVLAEADESDGSFLQLPATYEIITNIDSDHLDYFQSQENMDRAFVDFASRIPFYGLSVVCGDDLGMKRCLPKFSKPFLSYGKSEDLDYFFRSPTYEVGRTQFEVWKRSKHQVDPFQLGMVEIHIPGEHNVLNALAVTALADQIGISFAVVARALKGFKGVKRRFDIQWQDVDRKRMIVDDYGHHPTEIAATLSAARSQWSGRIITVFQPHRYSRTQHSKDGFLSAFRESDVVFITDIYSAGEAPIEGVTGESLVACVQQAQRKDQKIEYVGSLEQARSRVLEEFRDGDLLLCTGAGSITHLAGQLVAEIQK